VVHLGLQVDVGTPGDDTVTNAKLANMAANTVKVRDANSSGDPSDKALATTEILIGDGTGFTSASLSSDVTMTNAGAVTIATDAVTTAKILDDNVTTAKILDNNVTLAKLADGTQGDILYYGASGAPALLGFGTSGDFLKTQGTGANPVWAAASAVMTPAFFAVISGTQSITVDTWTKVAFDTEKFDEGGDYDHATNYRFTPTVAGKYFFYGSIMTDMSYTTPSRTIVSFRLNGSGLGYTESSVLGNGDYANAVGVQTSTFVVMDGSSDYMEFWVREEGVAYGVYTTGTQFGGFRVLT
jgi:hypothetical protein